MRGASRERKATLMRFTHTTIWVLDQDDALDFYTQKLGFEVNTDQRVDDFR